MNDYNLTADQFLDWKLYLFGGIAFVIFGIIAISAPEIVTVTLTILLGCLVLLGGVTQLIMTFKRKGVLTIFLSILGTIILFVMGVLLLVHPVLGLITLTMLISAYLFAQGVVQILMAFSLRPLKNWGWMLVSGILAILLAILILSNWPFNMVAFLGILVGIYLVMWGIAEILLAFSVRELKKAG